MYWGSERDRREEASVAPFGLKFEMPYQIACVLNNLNPTERALEPTWIIVDVDANIGGGIIIISSLTIDSCCF